ncbi:Ribosomal large subunit pseudouridine synthase B [termite gut metagenome]|uniref:Ribosomal large subunit pseudouridine synthase B n=1 Tax=termite gut metagenome TaxID=433724 RepID=A0A5J4RBU8_9ZZZZ
MNAENETWNERSQEEEKKNAGHSDNRSSDREGTTRRDDNRYPVKKENNYRREGGGVERPQRQGYSREGFQQRGERPGYHSNYNRDDNRPSQRGGRPNYNTGYNRDGNRSSQGGERPNYNTGYNRDGNRSSQGGERPNYNTGYNKEGNRPPHSSYDNRENNNRPQRSYNQGERPRRNNTGNEERKPWQKNTGNEFGNRPRFQRTNNADGHSPYTTNYRKEGDSRPSYKPRHTPDDGDNRSESFSRPIRRTADYNPNAKYSKKKQIEYKLQFVDPNEPIRLNKYLANAGVCSRRQADEYITTGVVTVNDVVMTELGTKIKRDDIVKFHDEKVTPERKVYVLLNKPKDCVTTSDDPQARLTVLDLVKDACNERIYPVGRLDRNTTGVLLLTNDGDLVSKLTHPQFLKKKVYYVSTNKNITKQDMEKIASGIQLEDGEIHADEIAYTDEIKHNQVGIEIHSGKNRIVRRIFESLDYKVIKLDRVFFAGLTKKGLRRGEWRYLTENEVNFLKMGSFE